MDKYQVDLQKTQIKLFSANDKHLGISSALNTIENALVSANEFIANKGKSQADLYAEAQEKKKKAEEAKAAREAKAKEQANLKKAMEEAAAAEAAEAERKKREAEEKAKVEAARKAAEQAKLNALGLEGKIEEYGRLLAGELSNADRFEF